MATTDWEEADVLANKVEGMEEYSVQQDQKEATTKQAAGPTGKSAVRESRNLSCAGAVSGAPTPLPSASFAARIQRSNTIVLHTQAFKNETSRKSWGRCERARTKVTSSVSNRFSGHAFALVSV